MFFRRIAAAVLGSVTALALTVAPASAMHWIIYAPDEGGYRYWMDVDSITTRDGYTFVTYVLGAPDSTAPTAPDGNRIGINCQTGDSVYETNGQTTPGPHFGPEAYLFKAVCNK